MYRRVLLAVMLASCGLGNRLYTDGTNGTDGTDAPVAGDDATAALLRVRGRVVLPSLVPLVGTTIYIPGHAPVQSDAAGAFAIDDVAAPYDLAIVGPSSVDIIWYAGLTRSDPTVQASASSLSRHAHFAGTISGGDAGHPLPNNNDDLITLWSPQWDWAGTGLQAGSPGNYAVDVAWHGDASVQIAIDVLQSSGSPWLVEGYGRTVVTAVDGGSYATVDVPLAHVAMSTITGATIADTVFTYTGFGIWAIRGDGHAHALERFLIPDSFSSTTGGPFALDVPVIQGIQYEVCQEARGTSGSTTECQSPIAGDATGIAFQLDAPPTVLSPDPDATIDATTELAFMVAGGVNIVTLMPDESFTGTTIELSIVTGASSVRLPDLSPLAIAYPSGTRYAWQVMNVRPALTVDDLAGPDGLTPRGHDVASKSTSRHVFMP